MRFTKTIASASVAAVLGLGGISVAGAASTSSSTPASSSTTAPAAAPDKPAAKKADRAVRRRHLIRRGVATSAKTIGVKPLDLAKELRDGKTIAEVATAHGVQPQTVIDALKTAATAKIEKAKAAGKITADRATKLEARLDKVAPKFVNDWHLKAKSK